MKYLNNNNVFGKKPLIENHYHFLIKELFSNNNYHISFTDGNIDLLNEVYIWFKSIRNLSFIEWSKYILKDVSILLLLGIFIIQL